MFHVVVFVLAIVFAPLVAKADPAPMTVEQCLTILNGLNSLNYAGQQLGDTSKAPADAKQYKFGKARIAIGFDIYQLSQVQAVMQDQHNAFLLKLPPLPATQQGKPDSDRVDAAQAQNRASQGDFQNLVSQPCPVTPGHVRADDLKIGDDPESNAIPPSVLGAIYSIIDGLK